MTDCMFYLPYVPVSDHGSNAFSDIDCMYRYWRSLRLYTISMEHLQVYKDWTGDTSRTAQLNHEERLMDDASLALPVGARGMAKTLLGSGGAARSFFIAARIV